MSARAASLAGGPDIGHPQCAAASQPLTLGPVVARDGWGRWWEIKQPWHLVTMVTVVITDRSGLLTLHLIALGNVHKGKNQIESLKLGYAGEKISQYLPVGNER